LHAEGTHKAVHLGNS